MTAEVDLVVVGGGPVGLGTALLAARAGLSTTVIEQRADPVDKACGEGLMPGALGILAGLGVAPEGRDFWGIRYLDATGRRSAQARFRAGAGRGVRRTTLQQALTAAVDRAGIRRAVARVEDVRQYGDGLEVAGLRGRYLAAADGLHSTVSRQYALERPARARPRFGLRRHYAVAPWSDFVEVHWANGAEAYVTPVSDGLVGVAVLTDQRGRSFDDWLLEFPVLRDRLAGAQPASATRGAGPLERNLARRVVGRVLLVGDAAGYVDALTGEGIAVGLASAQQLVAAVRADRPQEYERRWRQVSRPYRILTRGVLFAAERRPLRAAVVPAAAAAPAMFGRLVDALAQSRGETSRPEVSSQTLGY